MSALILGDLLRGDAGESEGELRGQIVSCKEGRTTGNKPFFDLEIGDGSHTARLKIWSDSQAFGQLSAERSGDFIGLGGRFFVNQFGLNVANPSARELAEEEIEFLLGGSEQQRERAAVDWQYLLERAEVMEDERFRLLAQLALQSQEKRWKRAAAARSFHHARRGGLLEHTASMMRCAVALAPLYPEVNSDLLCCGVLFHDSGKLWENDYPERGFAAKPNRTGELIGHISIGIEWVNKLWRECSAENEELFSNAAPASEILRDHLLHLVASHHGLREYGSPVTPRTPEAWLLHHIDNMDAKIEMLRSTYDEKGLVADGLYEPRRPLEGHAATPLQWVMRDGRSSGAEG